MLTKSQALTCPPEIWHKTKHNADGSPLRCRSNGKCRTWKTRPEGFRLPVKYGLRTCFYITEQNAHEWELPHHTAD